MRRRELVLITALGSLIALPAIVLAQQQSPTVWPPPPNAAEQQPPGARPDAPGAQPAPAPKTKKARKKSQPAPAEPPDPRFEEEPGAPDSAGPPGAAPPPARKAPARPALNILCDGPFAKDSSHDRLVKAFGARNVVAGVPPGGGSTVLFPNDPKRRLEVTWRDAAGRRRPASIVVEAQSTWRARGFRLGDPLAQVEKTNGKPFRLAGFAGEAGGTARDWQGGKLDKLSGGCMLGMRFAPDPKAPPDASGKVAVSGDLVSDNPDVKAAKPVIVELIVGYPE